MTRSPKSVLVLLVVVAAGACSTSPPKPTALDRLKPCVGDEGPTDAYCGTYAVFENRETKQGRKINLKIVVQPALGNQPKPEPLFFLAGGPGQGAAELSKQLKDAFRAIQREHDLVYIDQRGTGKSNPLNCSVDGDDDSLQSFNLEEGQKIARDALKKCLSGYDADVSLYTTTIAMDDLDEVRDYLGYNKINVYGGSYGTRAGLVYLRQHGDNVRAIILDGVAPTNMRLPLFFARDAQRALDKLLADCAADEACNAKYPNLADRTRALFTRLEKTPPRVKLTHPRSGATAEVTIEASLVASIIHSSLYSPLVASLLPEMIARAEHDDFQSLLAMVMVNEGVAQNMAIGMQLSVLCAEDFPRIRPEEAEKASAGTVFARHLMTQRMQACEFWPKGKVDASYYEPVKSDVPALVLSGEVDPVTPPEWGEETAKFLSKSRHVIVSKTGHGVIGTGCGMKMIRAFLTAGTVDGLDTSCATTVTRPPFFTTPAGPDPSRAAAKAKP